MQKNVAFFKRTEKNRAFRTEKNAVPNPAFFRLNQSKISIKINLIRSIFQLNFSTLSKGKS